MLLNLDPKTAAGSRNFYAISQIENKYLKYALLAEDEKTLAKIRIAFPEFFYQDEEDALHAKIPISLIRDFVYQLTLEDDKYLDLKDLEDDYEGYAIRLLERKQFAEYCKDVRWEDALSKINPQLGSFGFYSFEGTYDSKVRDEIVTQLVGKKYTFAMPIDFRGSTYIINDIETICCPVLTVVEGRMCLINDAEAFDDSELDSEEIIGESIGFKFPRNYQPKTVTLLPIEWFDLKA